MRPHPVITALIAAILVGGCSPGPKLFPASGTVTFEGAPVADGDILFIPVDTTLAPEPATIKDGKYHLLAHEGQQRVEIRASKIQPGGAKGAGGEPVPEEYLPRKYNSDSKLTADVKTSGGNQFDFPLTGK